MKLRLPTLWLALASLLITGPAVKAGGGAKAGGPGIPLPTTQTATEPGGCCGQRMALIGQAYIYGAPDGKAPDGTPVPENLRTEVYGNELVAKADLPAGTYTLEILTSENNFSQPGKRIFSVDVISGATPADLKGEPRNKTPIVRNVDLFALSGGMAKPYTIKATVKHEGGPLRIVFSSRVDNAKFSAIRIFDAQGNKVAWLFAEDLLDLIRAPDTPPTVTGPIIWKDATQPMDKRVADLIKRMTLKEKVRQMMNTAPAIERLGLPPYNYWSECLHGVARNGYATVFPQAIGMSATFDPALMQNVGDIIATEARAKYNDWQAQGGFDLYGGYFKGLTFWSPNINLFRDPRWGRGQETYGEDPFLTGTMGVAFIRGLQGNDPKYFKVIATAKHFAVHSGPELLRHTYNAAPPMRDFYESYLPHFEMAVREGKVYSVMGAYNRVYGAPACESDLLLKNLLRGQWGFDGYVVSDCGAIDDIWAHHEVETTKSAAVAGAVLAGCDLDCGGEYGALPLAVDLNQIGEGAIDQSLARVLLSRFRLGLFDPPNQVPYAAIPASANLAQTDRAAALRMAQESIVLLKNDGVLPLAHSARKIAVLGPNSDGLLPLLGNYNGTPLLPVTVIQGMADVYHGPIAWVRGCDNAAREGNEQLLPDICLHPAGARDPLETGLRAEYYDNEQLAGRPVVTRTEKAVDCRGLIQDTLDNVPIMQSSIRWSGEFIAPADGEYRLSVTGTSLYRLMLDGKTVSDQWTSTAAPASAPGAAGAPAATSPEAPLLRLKAGQRVPLVLECHQNGGVLNLQLWWNRPDVDVTRLVADRVKDADVLVFFGGLDGRMEAEENDIRGLFKGFDGGDRKAIELPPEQTALLKALAATGKPVVFVNMTGSAVAMPWEAEHVNGIVQAWYPGQAGGKAIADVLFGDVNPSGRLPVTFYAATSDLPAFMDYAMKGRTYRYYAGKPLWPFGHGLSYTTFRYAHAQVSTAEAGAGDTVTVSMDITNAGQRDGDEIVQLYARPANPAPGDALQRLVGFGRLSVRAGQTARASIPLSVQLLRNWDVEKKAYSVPPGRYQLMLGASSADIRATCEVTVR